MAASDVTFQDGLKHPYLLALVRWCVSSFWSTATVLLHRLITAPIPQVKAHRQTKPRAASYDHLHPEPRVHCEVLHAPDAHTLDVIFVHGLYGSLGNTWRQGEWQTKYDKQPKKVPLRRPHSLPTCQCTDEQDNCCSESKNNVVSEEINEISAKIDKISQQNGNNDKMRYSIRDKNDKLKDRNQFNNEKNEKYSNSDNNNIKERNIIDENNGIRQKDALNEDYDAIYKLKQKNTDIRITSCSVARNDIISENSLSYYDEFSDKNDEVSKKIEDFKVRIPSSKLQGYIRDINIEKDYNCSDGDIINTEDNSNLYDNIQKILPKENLFITEKFYNNTLLDNVDMGSYETQAQFVKDLFQNSVKVKSESEQNVKSEREVKAGDCKCEVKCETGCGCICDDCYSPCWPKDWIRVDYPGARVISINYTSDPYLWRPLWVKESKRLRLHERAEQMMSQLLDLGVGQRPIIWVGHSKGGLFIKKMYCEAYEAHLKLTKQETTKEDENKPANEQNTSESRNDNEINHCRDKQTDTIKGIIHIDDNLNEANEINVRINELNESVNTDIDKQGDQIDVNIHVNLNVLNDKINEVNKSVQEDQLMDGQYTDVCTNELNDRINEALSNNGNFNEFNDKVCDIVTRDVENSDNFDDNLIHNNRTEVGNESVLNGNSINAECDKNGNIPNLRTDYDEQENESLLNANGTELRRRATLWRASAGFMFYSVPHRGSPLADFKTPLTARSVELMEICKDCPLVLSLQQSWSVATAATVPPVRSLVETCRTLMSVLYLRIVSVDSADPGIGSLHGVDVDHREICKPSSRRCLLYRELMALMEAALRRHGLTTGEN